MVFGKHEILRETELYVREAMCKNANGHDWWHIYRVKNLALAIAQKEGGDKFIIEMAALLHDMDDWKIVGGGENAKRWMESLSLPESTIETILEIIGQVSFKGNYVEDNAVSTEAKIVQDADRLDAIGAIGIARAFAYGGSKGRLIFDPVEKPKSFYSFEEYKNSNGTTINHFYEKLLILKERINTPTAKILAEKRHYYMKNFLNHFLMEWDAEI
jgi:uncharacterized protein